MGECKHDWEVVEWGNIGNGEYDFKFAFGIGYRELIANRVCLKCAQCDDSLNKFRSERRQEKINARRRKAWAKQLWEDGCKKTNWGGIMKTTVLIITTIFFISCGGGGMSDDPSQVSVCVGQGGLVGTWLATNPVGVVILHQGHGCWNDYYYDMTVAAEFFQANGFDVYGLEMPPGVHGPPIESFYMPVVELIDNLATKLPIFIVGLSGGGGTATVATAIDLRIKKGYSVAGDIPIDLRIGGELSDWEQQNPPYPYRTMYSMAKNRLLHIFHEYDGCCFSYLDAFGFPRWDEALLGTPFVVDVTNNGNHSISDWALDYILNDMLNLV